MPMAVFFPDGITGIADMPAAAHIVGMENVHANQSTGIGLGSEKPGGTIQIQFLFQICIASASVLLLTGSVIKCILLSSHSLIETDTAREKNKNMKSWFTSIRHNRNTGDISHHGRTGTCRRDASS